jgi:hypothetical protein
MTQSITVIENLDACVAARAAPELLVRIDELCDAQANFTDQYVAGGRAALYALLGDIMIFVNLVEQSADQLQIISEVKKRLKEERGIKTQKNTSDVAALIRYITGTDRKTAHVYTRVIETARQKGILPSQLSAFIDGAGGVERIRALSVGDTDFDNQESNEERRALTEEYLSCRTELPLGSFEATEYLDSFSSNSAAYEYFVCSRRGDGRYHILSRLPATAEFERVAIKFLTDLVCDDIDKARDGVAQMRRRANDVIRARRQRERCDIGTEVSQSSI